jgi:hypothetical protein
VFIHDLGKGHFHEVEAMEVRGWEEARGWWMGKRKM